MFGIGFLGFFGFAFLTNTINPISSASAESTANKVTATPSDYSVSLSSLGNLDLTLETVPYVNVIRAAKDTVTANIKAPDSTASQFKLYLSTDSTTSNNLSNGTDNIVPVNGTITNPVTLTGNSWGFALANNASINPGLPTGTAFDTSYDIPEPTKASKWAAVPKKNQEQLIQTLSMNQPTGTTNTDIYYGVSAKDNLSEGTYTNNVVYTAIYDAAETKQEATLDPTEGTMNDEASITIPVKTTMEDIGSASVKMGDVQCIIEDISIIPAGEPNAGLIKITFKVPNMGETAYHPVEATLNKTGETYQAVQQYHYLKPEAYIVNYDANGGEGVPEREYEPTDFATHPDYTFQLTDLNDSTIPTRDGYTFGGWTEHAGNQAGAYSPGSEIYLKHTDDPETNRTEVTLYAIWIPNGEMGFGTLTGDQAKMQNMNQSVCGRVATGVTGRLQDTRDYKVYYVTKLKDNKCWMTQNLSLDIRSDADYKYTSASTNLPDAGSWEPGATTSKSVYKSTIPYQKLSTSIWKDEYDYQYSYNPGDSYFTTSGTTTNETETTYGNPHYATGNYYNWTAAKATNDSSSQINETTSSRDSICPKGWTLPNANSSFPSDFGTMLYNQGITDNSGYPPRYVTDGFKNIRTSPVYLVRAGHIVSGSRGGLGYYGSYWLRTTANSHYTYGAAFYSSSIYPRDSGSGRYFGSSIRCIAL